MAKAQKERRCGAEGNQGNGSPARRKAAATPAPRSLSRGSRCLCGTRPGASGSGDRFVTGMTVLVCVLEVCTTSRSAFRNISEGKIVMEISARSEPSLGVSRSEPSSSELLSFARRRCPEAVIRAEKPDRVKNVFCDIVL